MGCKVYEFEVQYASQSRRFFVLADGDDQAWASAAGWIGRLSHKVYSLTCLFTHLPTPENLQRVVEQ